jgi:DNA-binding GntR family transcriptional regulator
MGVETVVFSEIEAVSLRDKVIAALKEAFFSGALKPGDLIVERQLGRQMNVGTPAVREALVTLHEQGFVQRVANTATYVMKFTPEEVRQLYELRIEFELVALQWAKARASDHDLQTLAQIVDRMVDAAAAKKPREFYERDLEFHRHCWRISGNKFLARSLETLVTPLFAFVLSASRETVTESIAREHLKILNALRSLDEPEFSTVIRSTLSSFALRGISSMAGREGHRSEE